MDDGTDASHRPGQSRGVMDYLPSLLRWKKQILLFTAVVTVVAAGVSFLLPKWYQSSTVLLPPKNQVLGGLGPLTTLLKDFAPTSVGTRLSAGSSQVNYMAILKSRRAAESIIRRFDLLTVYDIDEGSMEKAVKEFNDNLSVEILEDGSIGVGVLDRDSVRAAAMTNAMVEVLNAIAFDLGTSEARSTRLFLEERVKENQSLLSAAEEKLRDFQEKRGVLVLSEDVKASASAVGELFAKKVRLDIEMSMLSKTVGQENERYKTLFLERSEIEKKLAGFPQMGMESFRLLRDVMIQQKIMEFLVPMAEQARFEEHKDIPVVLVLDKAVPAERKARPKRLLIIGSSALAAFLLAVMAAMTRVRFDLFSREHPDRYEALRSAFRTGRRA